MWGGPVLGCQECVARAYGEPVGLADYGAVDDLEFEVALADHLADDRDLLEVFLSEIGLVWRDVGEKF